MKKALILLFITVPAVVIILIYLNSPSRAFEKQTFSDKKIIIYEGTVVEDSLLRSGTDIYISFDFIKEYIDDDIFYDNDSGLVTIIYENRLTRLEIDKLLFKNDIAYIPVKIITDIYPINIEKTDTGLNIRDNRKDIRYAAAMEKVCIRHKKSIKSPYMEIIDLDEQVYVLEEDEKWLKVWSDSGSLGYTVKKEMSQISVEVAGSVVLERPRIILSDRKIFVWEMMYSQPDTTVIYPGIDIISPTWAQLLNRRGEITDRVYAAYAEELIANGTYIFLCVTNDFEDTGMTSEFLEDPDARIRFITNLINICKQYGFQGLNIDFENIDYGSRDNFTQLIREMSYYTHKEGLLLSVCTGVANGSPNYSLVYDHRKIGEFADYLMLMSYDELPFSGEVYGPVASLDWVGRKLSEILEMVTPEKIYLGISLYTRVWDVDEENNYSSTAVSIRRQYEILRENADGIYETDSESGQTVFKYIKEGTSYVMYIEDERVIKRRFDLINDNKLAGAAFWAKNYVSSGMFGKIIDNK